VSFLNSTIHGPTDFVCDPTRPEPRAKSVRVEIERTSLRPDKVRGLVGDPSGPWVWFGRVRVVEFRNETTRPDQRQSLAGPIQWTDPEQTQRNVSEHRVPDKVWSGPSSRIRA